MGFCGDAVKVDNQQLQGLMELYAKQTELRKITLESERLASGAHLSALHEEILALSQEVSAQRSKAEDTEREIARVAGDLELVEKRIQKDQGLINQSTNTKDIQGIQHEMDTLAKRKDELETAELELMEAIDLERSALEQLSERKRVLEQNLDLEREKTKVALDKMQAEILELTNQVGKLRAAADSELLAVFDQRAARSVPIGKLMQSTCGACNMSLTSTSMTELHKIPSDELARCPECSAILVRS